jgi:hypothetical protein
MLWEWKENTKKWDFSIEKLFVFKIKKPVSCDWLFYFCHCERSEKQSHFLDIARLPRRYPPTDRQALLAMTHKIILLLGLPEPQA